MDLTIEQQAKVNPSTGRFNRRDRNLIVVLALCIVTLYLRVRHFDFIADDDQLYVFSNIYVLQGATLRSLRWALSAELNGNWHPLSLWVQMIIASVFGTGPAAYHVLNLLLHALNVVLLYLFLRRSTGRVWPAFFASLLWGVHPMRVESVAWISELKDVLYGAFWLGAMLAYVHYARRRTVGRYALVAGLFALSLLSKPMAVTLPEALLLLDLWPLRNIGSVKENTTLLGWWRFRVVEKLPLVLLSIADVFRQANPITFNSPRLTFGVRAENAVVSYALYLRDTVFPWHLGIFYPHPTMLVHTGPAIAPLAVIVSAIMLLVITLMVCLQFRSRAYLAVGWFWFLGTLVPVIGLSQAGEQARADRFTYIPSIGLQFAIIWLICDLAPREKLLRQLIVATAAVVAAVFALISWSDIGYWENTDVLFDHLRQIQPNNYLAIAMVSERLRTTDLNQSLALGRQAVEIAPSSPQARLCYGLALQLAGKLDAAADQLVAATDVDPKMAASWQALGSVRESQASECALKHDPRETDFRLKAVNDLTAAITDDPANVPAMDHLAYQQDMLGNHDQAIAIWQKAVDIDPKYAIAQGDLADALRKKLDLSGAVEHYQAAIAAGAKNPAWETQLAYLVATNPLATMADIDPLVAIAKDACDQTQNKEPAALDAYAACLARVGRFDDAVTAAQQGVAQANAAHEPAVAAGIQRRLSLYQRQQPYVVAEATSKPTTAPN